MLALVRCTQPRLNVSCSLAKLLKAESLTAHHPPRCDPDTGPACNYGFTSIPETLGGDAGGNVGGGCGVPRSPAEVHL